VERERPPREASRSRRPPTRNRRRDDGDDEATPATISEDRSAGLAEAMRGLVIRPGDPGYDEARKLFNAMMDKRQALIARRWRATRSR
jgi:hypothetical protein